ncbi:MAG: glycosyltransferase family 2 protein [bacterium]|nr:glycosyltransferase family 2 protein [bacterium]
MQCLESIFRSDYRDFRVVVCDNDSSDGSLQKIKEWAEVPYAEYNREEAESGGEGSDDVPLVLIQTGSNWGYSGGNNVGIRYALTKNPDYIWLLNNDTLIEEATLSGLVDLMESDGSIGLGGNRIYLADEPGKLQMAGGGKITWLVGTDRFVKSRGRVDFISGTSLFIRGAVIDQIGLLDESFFFYWEDADYSARALKKGWKLEISEGAPVYHRFSASVVGQSLKSDRFKAASLTRYFKKHWKYGWIVPVTVNIGGMVVKRIFRGQFKRIIPILKEVFKRYR